MLLYSRPVWLPVHLCRSPANNFWIQWPVSTEADSNVEASEILSSPKFGENPQLEEKDLH